MGAMKAAHDLAIVSEPERARAVLSPTRRRLLTALRERPDSATGLAARLGETRQRLNYHVRALEDAGLVELVEERRKGNCTERILRATARHVLLDPTALDAGSADPRGVRDRFSAAWLVALAARAVRELARLGERARRQGKRLATLGMDTEVRLATPADLEAFAEDLTRAVARVVAKHHDEDAKGGRRFRVVVGAYPRPSGKETP